jgi:XTP/dITP diphosphohydrolase
MPHSSVHGRDNEGSHSDARRVAAGSRNARPVDGQPSEARPAVLPNGEVPRREAHRQPLIVATGNPGKLREFRDLLADLPFDVIAQSDLGIAAVEETGSSFLENALLKARHAASASGFAAIADDSGLEVDVLGGAPGIYSARYAGEHADDAANNEKLLAELAAVPLVSRTARYRCVLVFVAGPADTIPLIAEGAWEGRIGTAPRGSGGFGYDPYFYVPELGLTAAELDRADKNRGSHRGTAMCVLRARLAEREPMAAGEPLSERERLAFCGESVAREPWAAGRPPIPRS